MSCVVIAIHCVCRLVEEGVEGSCMIHGCGSDCNVGGMQGGTGRRDVNIVTRGGISQSGGRSRDKRAAALKGFYFPRMGYTSLAILQQKSCYQY